MSGTEEFKLIIHRIPRNVKFQMSLEELKMFHRWLYAAAHIKPSGLGNVLLVIELTKAYLKVNSILAYQKQKNKFSLTAEMALAFHNMVKASPMSSDVYEYTVISGIYHAIDRTFINAL